MGTSHRSRNVRSAISAKRRRISQKWSTICSISPRWEAGKTEMHFTRIHLVQLFSALRGVMRPLITTDAVSLVFEDPPENFFFESDESKIAQILRNLFSNAPTSTEKGEVRISSEVSASRLHV